MASTKYQYTTSPRKLEPDYNKRKKPKKQKLKIVEDVKRQDIKVSKEQRKERVKITMLILMMFGVLFTISYRDSKIKSKY